MSDKATMLHEPVATFADLRTMLDGLTEEQARRIRLGVLGVRDLVIRWPEMLCGCGGQIFTTDPAVSLPSIVSSPFRAESKKAGRASQATFA